MKTSALTSLAVLAMFSSVAQAGIPQVFPATMDKYRTCAENLTDGYSKTSVVFQVIGLDTPFGYEDKASIKMNIMSSSLSVALGTLHCTDNDLGIAPQRLDINGCRLIRNGRKETEVCVLNSAIGLFTLTQDYTGNLNVIFTAWD